MLQKSKMVAAAGDIKCCLGKRADSWEAGKVDILVQQTERAASARCTQSAEILFATAPDRKSRKISRRVETGARLSALPSMVSVTELSAREFVAPFPRAAERLHPAFQLAGMVVMLRSPFSTPLRAKWVVL